MEYLNKGLYLEPLFEYISIWAVHLGRITFWFMLGAACLTLFFRFVLLKLYPERLNLHLTNYPSALKLTLLSGLMLFGFSVSALYVIRPDVQFLANYGEMAIRRRDYSDAI